MSAKLEYPFGSSVNSGGSDPTKLPLSGGTMDASATVIFPQYSGRDSELGAWGLGVENTNGSYATVEPLAFTLNNREITDLTQTLTFGQFNNSFGEPVTGFKFTNLGTGNENIGSGSGAGYIANGDWRWWTGSVNEGDATTRMIINGGAFWLESQEYGNCGIGGYLGGVHFTDGTIQSTASTPFDGGTINNPLFILDEETGGNVLVEKRYIIGDDGDGGQWGLGSGGFGGYDNGSHLGLNNSMVFGNEHEWEFGTAGLKFSDSSTQTTAGIPEAPIDGNAYVRKNGAWVNITTL